MLSTPTALWLDRMHRVGAAMLGVGLCVFGALGFVRRLEFLAVHGQNVLGLSSNGLLSAISLVVGAILIVAGLRGERISSTITVVIGSLFLLSGLVNLAVLNTKFNFLAFRMPNVFFSFIAGILLLSLGAYGRFSAGLSADNPYYQHRHPSDPRPDGSDPELDRWVAAEVAVAEGHATPEQEQMVYEDARRRAAEHAATRGSSTGVARNATCPHRRSQRRVVVGQRTC